MGRGLGKIEREVLRCCVQCLFISDTIKDGKTYKYPGGTRFREKGGQYQRIVSIGSPSPIRWFLRDEEIIDLKEVHYVYKQRFGKTKGLSGILQDSTIYAIDEILPMVGIRIDLKILTRSQEVSYQRAVKSLLRKEYLKFTEGHTRRFVTINRDKIKPIKPKR